jgi:hypothetical protein
VNRASEFTYPPGVSLRTCSAEDLIVMKAFAGRGQDWVDVERIIVRQTGRLDWAHIREQLAPLAELKGEPEIVEQLERRPDHRHKRRDELSPVKVAEHEAKSIIATFRGTHLLRT